MKKTRMLSLLIAAIFLVFCSLAAAQKPESKTTQTRNMKKTTLTGKIAKAKHGYIIKSRRGKAPGEIYTILNPEPKVLDALVKSKKNVSIAVRIVSGDNVAIEKIDGKNYPNGAQ